MTTPDYLVVAACKESSLDFFSERGSMVKQCKALCASCQGRIGCLRDALAMEKGNDSKRFGVWGGTTPAQRSRLDKSRGAKVPR